jgi:hypothetical protein
MWYASHKTLALWLTQLLNGIMVTIDISRPFSLCTLKSNLPTTKKNPSPEQKHN